MSLDIFLIGMQVAGNVLDYAGTRQEINRGRAGTQIEQEQIQNRLEQERLASANDSLLALIELRKNLASQRAIFAARGQRAGTGTALSLAQESIGNASANEQVRRMNLLSREANLRANKALSGLHQLTSETKLGQSMSQRMIEQLPISQAYQGLQRRGGGFGIEEKTNG
jgi:hypothetical protein